jgi:hypothetical protein
MRSVGTIICPAIILLQSARAANAVFYTVTLLHPSGFYGSQAFAVSGNSQAGVATAATGSPSHAALWNGTAASYVDLHPGGFPLNSSSEARGFSGNTQVGYAGDHAGLWTGTAGSFVDLNPPGFTSSGAEGVSGNIQVGGGSGPATVGGHALLWTGTAASFVDLHPPGYAVSDAFGVSGNTEVGVGTSNTDFQDHALLWHGTVASYVDLQPAGFITSEARGASGNTQVGSASTGSHRHAMLWTGTAASFVDLHPAGFVDSWADGASGSSQVGWAVTQAGNAHALLWNGTATSALDLHQFVTGLSITFVQSRARGIDPNGDIVGWGMDANNIAYALKWSPSEIPEPSSIVFISLAGFVQVGMQRTRSLKKRA